MQANRKYIYVSKTHTFTCCPTAKHPKHNQLAVKNILEKAVDFFMVKHNFISCNNFANLDSFAKFSISVRSIIFWGLWLCLWELWHSMLLIRECNNSHKQSRSPLTISAHVRWLIHNSLMILGKVLRQNIRLYKKKLLKCWFLLHNGVANKSSIWFVHL